MKKLLFYALPAMLLLGACSEEVIVDRNLSTDQISFRATTNSTTRAAESYCANNLPSDFTVWASTSNDDILYIGGTEVEKSGDKYSFSDGVERFWPNEGGLDFIAYRSEEHTFNGKTAIPAFENYVIKDNVADQLDLLYAVKKNATRAQGPVVNLNMRHALCQVVFRAQVTNPTLKVVVKGISIGHLYNKGTFNLPTAEGTDNNWLDEDHNDNIAPTFGDNTGLGEWVNYANTTGNFNEYSIDCNVPMVNGSGIQTLSASPEGHYATGDWSKVMTLLPQHQDAWDPTAGYLDGSYICANCEIYNVVIDPEGAGYQEVLISNKPAYIPLTIDWRQGIRYVYTLKFGNGGAGYIDPENPEPTPNLSSIEIDLTTDDFINEEFNQEASTFNNFYSVSFSVDDKVVNAPVTVKEGSNDDIYNFVIPQAPGMKRGRGNFKFLGWSTEGHAGLLQAGEVVTLTKANPNVTLTANWEQIQGRVEFIGNFDYAPGYDLSEYPVDDIDIQYANMGEDYTEKIYWIQPNTPKREGYTFAYWAMEGSDEHYMPGKSYLLYERDGQLKQYFYFKAVWVKVEE